MAVRNVEFTEEGFFIREERGKLKKQIVMCMRMRQLEKHIQMGNSKIDRNEL